MKWRNFCLVGAGTLLLLGSTAYWYVFVAGAPQLDPPPVEKNTGLTFQLETFGGQSSEGWGAVNIGLRYLNNFNILFSSSGYFTDGSGPENSPQDFIARVPAQQRQHLRIFLDAGEDDKEFLASTRQFHKTLNRLGIRNEFQIYPGGHGIVGANSGWNYWHKHLFDQLTYVGEQFEIALAQQQKTR